MSITIVVDSYKRIVLTTLFGIVTDEDLLNHVKELRFGSEHEAFDELVQSRGELRLRVTEAGVKQLAELVQGGPPAGRTHRLAIVAKTQTGASLAKYYRSLMAGKGTVVRTFDSYSEAITWLRPPQPATDAAGGQ